MGKMLAFCECLVWVFVERCCEIVGMKFGGEMTVLVDICRGVDKHCLE